MINIRPSQERGFADHGWLQARHSFSFADYFDPAEMGWGALRVINEDRVQPGTGFGRHGHRDMEIVTYMLGGALEHRDSLGHGGIIRRGEVQRMSAGSGIMHSEFNPSADEESHLLQIWIEPARRGEAPGYEQKPIPMVDLQGRLCLLAGPAGSGGIVSIGQEARIYAALLEPGQRIATPLDPARAAYVQLIRGALDLNGFALAAGDGAKIANERQLVFTAAEASEFLLFDLPPLH